MAEKKSIDVKAVFNRLGGPSKVHRLLIEAGHDITKSGIEKWSSRGRIPSDWFATLIDLAKKINKPIAVAKFIGSAKEASPRVSEG